MDTDNHSTDLAISVLRVLPASRVTHTRAAVFLDLLLEDLTGRH